MEWTTYVKVKGKNSDILEIKYVLMSRPLVYKLANDGKVYQTAKEWGFKKIVFSDGYDSSWTYDLTKE